MGSVEDNKMAKARELEDGVLKSLGGKVIDTRWRPQDEKAYQKAGGREKDDLPSAGWLRSVGGQYFYRQPKPVEAPRRE